MPDISVVIPFLNEAECLPALLATIEGYAAQQEFSLEIVLVDDGSIDDSVAIVRTAIPKNFSIKLIRLSRNYGSHAAIRAGILHATSPNCFFIGADLQEPLELIGITYKKLMEGYDAVLVQKKQVAVSRAERLFSHLYARMMRKFALRNFPDGGVNNIMFGEKIKKAINSNIETNSSIMLQIISLGFRQAVVESDFAPRTRGVSKWTLGNKIKLFIDSFVAFSFFPIRLISVIGILMALAGFLLGVAVIAIKIFHPTALQLGWPMLIGVITFGFGITNISLGVIAEYLWRTLDASRHRPVFLISELFVINKESEHA